MKMWYLAWWLLKASTPPLLPEAEAAPSHALSEALGSVAQALSYIENYSLNPVSATELGHAAIAGAMRKLDAHSCFLPPRAFAHSAEHDQGRFAGIGIELDCHHHQVQVAKVLPASPAAAAGVAVGMAIVSIDQFVLQSCLSACRAPCCQRCWTQLENKLLGPVDSNVVLQLQDKAGVRVVHRLQRKMVNLPAYTLVWLPHQLVWLRVAHFSQHVAADILQSLRQYPQRSQRLILDLRGNPGGILEEAVGLADLFLKAGTIVQVLGRDHALLTKHVAQNNRLWLENIPMAVLIDAQSASAAEIVAAALKEQARARLFGVRSFGKGSVQSVLPLSDGSGIKLTVATYTTGKAQPIDGIGVWPDRVVASEAVTPDLPLQAAVAYLDAPVKTVTPSPYPQAKELH